MKKIVFIGFFIVLISGYCFFSCKRANQHPEMAIAQTVIAQVDSFSANKDK